MTYRELSNLFYINKEIESIHHKLKELESTLISSSKISEMPKVIAPTSSSEEKFVEKKEKLEKKLQINMVRYMDEMIRIEDFIKTIEDYEMRQIIRMRFVELKSYEEIGDKLYMNRRTVARKLKKFLK